MNKICSLVTGGGGFIGSHLVKELLDRGETVKVLELSDALLLMHYLRHLNRILILE